MMDDLYNHITRIISQETNEQGQPFSLGKFEAFGWIQFPEGSNLNPDDYPMITVKEYDKTVNIYAYLWDHDPAYYQELETIFGKTAMGKSCIRIRVLNDKRIAAIKDIVSRLKKSQYEPIS